MTCASAGQKRALISAFRKISCSCYVIRKRIDPDIHHMLRGGLRARRNLDAPVEGRARHREVREPALHEGDDLVLIVFGRDEVRMRRVMREQFFRIGRQFEEPALLLHPLDRRARRREFLAVPLGEFVLVVIGLVAHRIPAGVFGEIEVAVRLHAPPHFEHGLLVARLRRAHDVVGAGVQRLAHPGELRGRAVGERPRRQPFLLGRALHLLPVLVHAGDKQHVIAVEPLPSREGVGGDALIGVTDMRRAIRIGNGRRDHVGGTFRHGSGLARFLGAGKRPRGHSRNGASADRHFSCFWANVSDACAGLVEGSRREAIAAARTDSLGRTSR